MFNQSAAFAVIIVQITLNRRVQQAPEMIQAVPVMTADRRTKGYGHFARVVIVAKLHEERFALRKCFNYRLDEFLRFKFIGLHG